MDDVKRRIKLEPKQKEKLLVAGKGRILEQELEEIETDILPSIYRLMEMCGGDPSGNGQKDTPYRVAKAWMEMSEGYTEDPREHLNTSFDLDDGDKEIEKDEDDLVIVENITIKSVCEHHILPFIGTVDIGYIPKTKVLGLSKFARLVRGYASRFQIQEKLGAQIAKAIMEEADAKGVIVKINAVHTCMIARGVREKNSNTVTVAVRGVFKEDKMLEQKFLTATGGNR
jgi:GTP cyclohydrolase I